MHRFWKNLLSTVTLFIAGCAGVETQPPAYQVAEGGALVVPPTHGVLADHRASPSTEVVMVEAPEHASLFVLGKDGGFRYVHNGTETERDGFSYRIRSGGTGAATGRAVIDILPTNDAPVVRDVILETRSGATAGGQLLAFDPDDRELTFSAEVPKGGVLRLEPDTGKFAYEPLSGFAGVDRFKIFVTDGRGGKTATTVTVYVNVPPDAVEQPAAELNRAPQVNDLHLQVKEDKTVKTRLEAADPDSDPLTYTVSIPEHGLASVTRTGVVQYGPQPDFNGRDSFTVTVTDRHGASTESAISVDVTGVNDPPTAGTAVYRVAAGGTIQGRLPARDVDDLGLTYELTEAGTLGTVELVEGSGGRFRYTAADHAVGTDRIGFRVSDGKATASGEVLIRIDGPPEQRADRRPPALP